MRAILLLIFISTAWTESNSLSSSSSESDSNSNDNSDVDVKHNKRGLPDIEVDIPALCDEPLITVTPIDELKCALEEGCLNVKPGRREKKKRVLLRFNVQTNNIGTAPFLPNGDRSTWTYHKCHKHLHGVAVFAKYYIYYIDNNKKNGIGKKVVSGLKASFCLEDTVCKEGTERKFTNCNKSQGITPKCSDVYRKYLDCQWIDCTYVPLGKYKIVVSVNPNKEIKESNYKNNAAICDLKLYEKKGTKKAKIYNCILTGLDNLS